MIRNCRDDAGRVLPALDAVFLSDLDTDPGEKKNLAAERSEEVARLARLLDRWLVEVARP